MSRFDEQGLRRFRARDAVLAVFLTTLIVTLAAGSSIRDAGERMDPGVQRTLVLVVGRPAGWLADRLPIADAVSHATSGLSPDGALDGEGFTTVAARSGGEAVPPVTRDAFDPAALGAAPPRARLGTLLVTGDSMSTPLDTELAHRFAGKGVKVIREPHLGTGISKTFLVDWAKLSSRQVAQLHPDAVVVFIGANEGFPMPVPGGEEVKCCGSDWAAAYATRVRTVMHTFRQDGNASVYWLTLPQPRDDDRAKVTRVVNAAIRAAAAPWLAQVHVLDTVPIFTPSGYRDAMDVDGRETIVRESDGIHLNRTGSGLLADEVAGALARQYAY